MSEFPTEKPISRFTQWSLKGALPHVYATWNYKALNNILFYFVYSSIGNWVSERSDVSSLVAMLFFILAFVNVLFLCYNCFRGLAAWFARRGTNLKQVNLYTHYFTPRSSDFESSWEEIRVEVQEAALGEEKKNER